MRWFITGATGLVGRYLCRRCVEAGDAVIALARRPDRAALRLPASVQIVPGDATAGGSWQQHVATADVVVNLAGENIFARRWSAAFREQIRGSRIEATRRVVEAIESAPSRPAVLINASAVGYYGPRAREPIDESAGAGGDFLAEVCAAWESAARQAEPLGVRVVLLRLGIVLARDGGALARMLTPFRLGLGGPVGSGDQGVSWIHIADLVRLIEFAARSDVLRGPVNAVAPQPASNREFARTLASVLHRPAWLPMPGWLLRLVLGEVADVLLTGQYAIPRAAEEAGFEFRFPTLRSALEDLLRESPRRAGAGA